MIKKGGELFGHPMKTICIPTQFKYNMQYLPSSPSQTKINIVMTLIQIIKIDTESITIRLFRKIDWEDHRLELMSGSQSIYIRESDQKLIWSPEIVFGPDMVLEHKEDGDFILKDNNDGSGVSLTKKLRLSTTFKCDMDFQNFPFDKHVCNIEVVYYFSCWLVTVERFQA